MTTNYPGALDAFVNPTPGTVPLATTFGGRTHSQEHGDVNDAVEAIQAKVGITGSTVAGTVDRRLQILEGVAPLPQVFAASGSLTLASVTTALGQVPYALRVRVWGPGGGGGGSGTAAAGQISAAGGGAGGGYAESVLLHTGVTYPVTITVGTGGAGGAGSAGAGSNGVNGSGSSSFAAQVVAAAGSFGVGGPASAVGVGAILATGGVAGAGTTGDLKVTGGDGGHSYSLSAQNGIGGRGGSAGQGGGTTNEAINTAAGGAGHFPGGGGGGAQSRNGGALQAGGAGANGLVIVEPIYK